ncbi:unnamed protein product [Meganyctiphanes norvegica]|uniref:Growth arrest-specific protein 1 n=1 Tax=Meganyctiphanes norvegica TaxID=48144 RepID=A0AAV2Q7P4_MEGNR
MTSMVVFLLAMAPLSLVGSENDTWSPRSRGSGQNSNMSGTRQSYSNSSSTTTPVPPPIGCVEARIKCALRAGCGHALQNYMLGCSDMMSGRINYCDEYCKNSLIALTSTKEGHLLMDCECEDNYCRETKARVEVCRDEVVVANADSSVLSCSVAQWICAADTLCANALSWYDKFCRRMFQGKGCSSRCNNSLSILQRQEKAAKLESCVCDGTESFDCHGIKHNMARLCFHQFDESELQREEEMTNEIDTSSKAWTVPTSDAGGALRAHSSWRHLTAMLAIAAWLTAVMSKT